MSTISKTILATAVLGLVGTSAAQTPPTQEPEATETCPEFLKGAQLSVSDIDGGVAFEVTARTATDAIPLRAMLRELAAIVERHTQVATTSNDAATFEIPPIDIGVMDIASGARVSVTAERASDVPLVRAQAQQVQQAFRGSACINHFD